MENMARNEHVSDNFVRLCLLSPLLLHTNSLNGCSVSFESRNAMSEIVLIFLRSIQSKTKARTEYFSWTWDIAIEHSEFIKKH